MMLFKRFSIFRHNLPVHRCFQSGHVLYLSGKYDSQMKACTITFLLFCLFSIPLHAQNFKKEQQSQERTIKAAQRKHRISDREYEKLMREQYAIKQAIEKAAFDGIWTAREKNAVAGKLDRAENRLRRYKTNGEVY